jgi:hypothetical protein
MDGITLQISLSPGDLSYAPLTVPGLIRKHHRNSLAEVLLVLDATRGDRTRIFNPNRRGTLDEFATKVDRAIKLAAEWKRDGLVDRVEVLHPNDPLISQISSRWCGGLIKHTHDYGGCALMAYFTAFEHCRTRYLLHYDADMLLYQKEGFDWPTRAVSLLANQPHGIAARPRISPFFDATPASDGPSLHEALPLRRVPGGWANSWFSTRCFLFDADRLKGLLPLISWQQMPGIRLRQIVDRGYPPSPEIMLFRRLKRAGLYCLNLDSEDAWLLHPQTKSVEYLEFLPEIMAMVNGGECPPEQRGYADIKLAAWKQYLCASY